ncbi:odorant receptor coreceptor-like [Aricia agestis]|uniref:odorant receptor coreceptor-like n=1 Tax=Aricia agestis TaxID=91739 RepID=UPI001C20A85B|nr:odorant receptor coreceptor-like [Aricia agestis]
MSYPYQRYFSFHYILLRCLGLGWWHHPDENDTRNFPGFYLFYAIITELVWVGGFVGLETIDPFIGEKDIDRFMFSLSFVVTHDLTCIKLYIFFFKNKDIQAIVHTLNIDLHQFYQNNDINLKTIKTSRKLTAMFLFFGWITIANSNVYGILQDISWKAEVAQLNSSMPKPPRTLPQPIYIPWKYETNKAYISSFLLETVGILWTGHIVMIIDTFIGSLILHMSAQFLILQEAFTTAYSRTMESLIDKANKNNDMDQIEITDYSYNDDDKYESIVQSFYSKAEIDSALEKTLRHCFRQHQMLINCVEKFAVTYSYGFMTQLLSSMAAICVVMVQVSKDASSFKSVRLVTSIAFFAAMILQLALQCVTGNELTYQAGRVSEAVMSCKWERMSPRLRRSLLMTMMRAQRPLRLTAGGFANMDNACFLAIMKAAYSYYAVLSEKQN